MTPLTQAEKYPGNGFLCHKCEQLYFGAACTDCPKIPMSNETQITGATSDGYHTFNELYDHRITLWIALCRVYESKCASFIWETSTGKPDGAWRSKLHSDGSTYDGWFLLGLNKKAGSQMTYHLPLGRWDETEFAETLEKAPEFDGHSSQEVLNRIASL